MLYVYFDYYTEILYPEEGQTNVLVYFGLACVFKICFIRLNFYFIYHQSKLNATRQQTEF